MATYTCVERWWYTTRPIRFFTRLCPGVGRGSSPALCGAQNIAAISYGVLSLGVISSPWQSLLAGPHSFQLSFQQPHGHRCSEHSYCGHLMHRCFEAPAIRQTRVRQDHSFYAEVIKLKLNQSVTPCEKLCQLVKKEVGKHARCPLLGRFGRESSQSLRTGCCAAKSRRWILHNLHVLETMMKCTLQNMQRALHLQKDQSISVGAR